MYMYAVHCITVRSIHVGKKSREPDSCVTGEISYTNTINICMYKCICITTDSITDELRIQLRY